MSDDSSNAVQPFDFKGNAVRVIMINGEPWFVAVDVARVLGYQDARATRMLRDREKGIHPLDTPGGQQKFTIISEQGLYRLVMRSERAEAEEFQDWVTGEVLPSIRKTGAYVVGQQAVLDPLDTLQIMIDTLRAQKADMAELGARLTDTEDRLASVEGRREWMTAVSYSRQFGLPSHHCSHGYLNRLGTVAGRIGRDMGLQSEKARDEKYGFVNMWPVEVWDSAYGELQRRQP